MAHHVQGKPEGGQEEEEEEEGPNILIEDALGALCDARLECHEAVEEGCMVSQMNMRTPCRQS